MNEQRSFADELAAGMGPARAKSKAFTLGTFDDVTMEQYLSLPAVSSSLIAKLLDECPYAAWYESWLAAPAQGEEDEVEEGPAEKVKRRGTIAHQILLEGSDDCCEKIDPNDYPAKTTGNIPKGFTNNAIREAREDAKRRGKIPVLLDDLAEINAMVDAAREFIESVRHNEPAIWNAFQPDGGRSEVTMTWDDNGTPCKMRPDRISNDNKLMIHVKTSGRSAEPNAWGRSQLSGAGYYRSEAFYRRGARALGFHGAVGVFLVIPAFAPYVCSFVGVDPIWQAGGDSEVELGMRSWRKCFDAKHWPKHPSRVCYPEAPSFLMAQWEAKQAGEELGNPYSLDQVFKKNVDIEQRYAKKELTQ